MTATPTPPEPSAPRALDSLAELLVGLERGGAQAIQATLADVPTLRAAGAQAAALTRPWSAIPQSPQRPRPPEIGSRRQGLEASYPTALLTATRAGWATAAAGAATWASARGAADGELIREVAELQAGLYATAAPKLAPSPRTLEWSEGSARLWRLRGGEGTPTVVVCSFVNRFYLLDLLSDQSLIRELMTGLAGPILLLDWAEGGPEGLEELLGLLDRALARWDQVDLFGYSTGGTLAAIHAARRPGRVARLAVFGAPIDATRGGRFAAWSEHADFGAISSALPAVPAAWVHAPFWALRPTVNVSKLASLLRRWRRPDYLDRFLAVELWNNDNVSIGANLYRDWGQRIYRDNALWEGDLADLGAIECPALAIAAEQDGIVPAACTLALAERTGEGRSIPGGHVGLLWGRRGLRELSRTLIDFLGADR